MKIKEVGKENPTKVAIQIAQELAIKHFQSQGIEIGKKQIHIRKDSAGKPSIEIDLVGSSTNLFLSLSHTKDFAAASIEENSPIGIDIENIRSFSQQFLQGFLSTREFEQLKLCRPGDFDTQATLLWSFKEAYLKALGVGLRRHPQKIEILKEENGEFVLKDSLAPTLTELWYNVNHLDGYVITKVVLKT